MGIRGVREETDMEVKDIIRTRREELGLTLKEVARSCNVSESTILRWETGDIENMKRNRIMSLANVLKLHPGVLMGWADYDYISLEESRMIDNFRKLTPSQKNSIKMLIDSMIGG
jgi:transcriptional regulator with XRE-family HTH domain